jgi:phage/plasmid-associated DNA primase
VWQHLSTCIKIERESDESLTEEQLLATAKPAKGSSQQGCKFKFPTAVQLDHHMEMHKEKIVYYGRNFGSKKEALIKDVSKSRLPTKRPKIYACKFCGENFSCMIKHSKHIQTHIAPFGVLKCTYIGCNCTFTCTKDMKEHALVHKAKVVKKPAQKKTGRKITPGYLNCTERWCKKQFKTPAELKQHMLMTHSESLKQPYPLADNLHSCDLCGKCLTSNSRLDAHKRRHLQEWPFACDVPGCSYFGKAKIDVWKHARKVHGSVSECPL